MCSREWERGPRVVKCRGGPRRRVMALFAGLREAGADVVGIRGLLEICQMAAHALGRRAREVAADVALHALHARMRPGQGEPGPGMIELRSLPIVHRVALRAV